MLARLATNAVWADEPLELKVKAAFVFNFVRFTTWPPERLPMPETPIELCVLDGNALSASLREAVAGKSVGSHPLLVREVSDVTDLRGCHLAYVDGADPPHLLAASGGLGILTVHDGAAVQRDGVVRLYLEDRRLRFEINTAAAARANLQLSSKLLSLASVVAL